MELMPGLPISALATFCPMLAAVVLITRQGKKGELSSFFKRAFDFKRVTSPLWYAALLLLPAVAVLSLWILSLSDTNIPSLHILVVPTLTLCVLFFIAALGEELGWSGYILEPMQQRWGTLPASLGLGLFWAAYHFVGLAQVNRAWTWIAWWTLGTVALRVIMVWLYNNSGKSVFIIALFHMTINLVWQLFPDNGSLYDPRIAGLTLGVLAICIVAFGRPKKRLST